jgi:dCMP deaminase
MKRVLVLYVPVLHEGYIKLFEKYRGKADVLYLLGEDIVADFFPLHKEIRALGSGTAKNLISALNIFPTVAVLDKKAAGASGADGPNNFKDAEIITATDEVCRKAVHKYFPKNKAVYESIFLRWDEKNVKSSTDIKYDRTSEDGFDREMCAAAANEAEQSSDWWRHVGAVVVKGGKIIFKAHNHHVPTEHMPYIQGDPRDVIESGTLNLVYSSLHAEQTINAEAAQKGISLEGASMYLNIFPCPLCAKLMAYAGIKKCFFKTGSAWLDAESVLRAQGVEIVLVK